MYLKPGYNFSSIENGSKPWIGYERLKQTDGIK